jgi:hypothetical protein
MGGGATFYTNLVQVERCPVDEEALLRLKTDPSLRSG